MLRLLATALWQALRRVASAGEIARAGSPLLFFRQGEADGLARAHEVPERPLDAGPPLSAWLRCAGVFAFMGCRQRWSLSHWSSWATWSLELLIAIASDPLDRAQLPRPTGVVLAAAAFGSRNVLFIAVFGWCANFERGAPF